ncbi:MutL C-terminal dimerization domain protein [Treponema socranskii subsp. socranskii VPI DR56BR1116 = ATCC 35536]|uniref:DNA mismatch repair protein MutL n=1 Tax=Treponema socranskii subsp. socranskii VPI DR56BR1116 = ATCC 35536 TaxID=1125725 RepID=U1FMG9_TRESO|nr:DNA mismatch repair endonuclease MutL [Treponema socranskii]ERF61048.1 MutL C-terminal dimerization domain protein [Treponema socranskii subsp. socranskii VPI DR56BR1116 = ATCC 35536]ERK00439.1 MutL C-terminal dimerization domain protein [Treponema socranskii subsp. socranskii VPI DR56BR1116 = ATCC 35536]
MSDAKPVRQLSAEVARKIAAGEVIDRPNAIVRELMDNAVDSGADGIAVEIDSGGIEKVRVVDNGSGMTKSDLQNCARPHATSKIETETDLLRLSTLGFRGEALSSIAAVCRLSIISGGWKMRASVTEDHIIERSASTAGTIVQAEGLFENFPARRRFLKRPAAEALMCKNTFIEKTLARPDIAFSFTADGERRITLEAGTSLKKRFVEAALPSENASLFYEISGSSGGENPDWSFTCVIGEPGVSRTNKKDIYIFVNGRRITEYSLVQAIEYGGQGYFPNGTYPAAALFVTMKSDLVDFNIHPAKKEARFRDIASLHHGVSGALRNFFHQYTLREMKNDRNDEINNFQSFDFDAAGGSGKGISYGKNKDSIRQAKDFSRIVMHRGAGDFTNPYAREYKTDAYKARYSINHEAQDVPLELAKKALSFDETRDGTASDAADKTKLYDIENAAEKIKTTNGGFHFLGSALGTFLVAEKGDTLYIIDQHAAHERILYDAIMQNQGKSQTLLVPYEIVTQNAADDIYLTRIRDEMKKAGIAAKNKGNGVWEIRSVPERWKGSENDLYRALLEKRVAPEDVISEIAAMTACKAAVKDGYVLDDAAASDLAEKALTLPDPHCPHGRPVWTAVTRAELFALVKRT